MRTIYLFLLFFVLISCHNNTHFSQKKCLSLIQKEIENSPHYAELITFKKHLIEHQLLIKDEQESYRNLVFKFIDNPTAFEAILNLYQYDYQYTLVLKNDCQQTTIPSSYSKEIHHTLFNDLKSNPSEPKLLEFKEFIKKLYKDLDQNFIQSKTFNYITLHELYSSSLKSKIETLNTLNLNITVDQLFIEDQVTTISTLKTDLESIIQHRKSFLKSLDLKDSLSLKMHVNPSVKMGLIMDIKDTIKTINYNQISNITIK